MYSISYDDFASHNSTRITTWALVQDIYVTQRLLHLHEEPKGEDWIHPMVDGEDL